jgi:predicted branched-subunit amino acid permease
MGKNITYWKKGFKDSIPICLGYIAVSFTFGIAARNVGLTSFQSSLMSATNYTSAGQFSAIGLIGVSALYFEMAVTQLVINLRYCLMSCALAQKLTERTPLIHKFIMAFGITDEIFGVSVCTEGKLNPFYIYGAMSAAMPGWVFGTFLGVISGDILSPRIISTLSVALYAMFIAVIIPPAKGNRVLAGLIILSMFCSFIFSKVRLLSAISPGFKIIILTVLIAGAATVFFPLKEERYEG